VPEILLVDDHSQVLSGMRQATHLSREHWTLGWAMDGPGALEYLGDHQVDVLVADVGIPGMDGATLLDEVRRRFPDTARIVLSDGADRDAVLSAAGCAQQFLSKSCDPITLVATLDSILSARALVQDPQLRAMLGGLDSLPRPPEIYAELVALANRSNSTVTDVAQLVERDVSTTAEVLKLVNSSFFALNSEVNSVSRAVTLLGPKVIQSLVLAGQAFRPARKLPPGLVAADLAAEGLRASKWINSNLASAGWSEQAFAELSIAALLYNVGLLTLAANRPSAWAEYARLSSSRPPREAQLSAFGCTVGRAGGYVLGLWGFHANIVNAIADQPIDLDDEAACAAASPGALAVAMAHSAAVTDDALARSGG
jgi:HD-like signal output (HDOD) protein/CheY-like chemotaxis protein